MSDPDTSRPRRSRGRRLLIWLVVFVLSLPILFYLFEFVVPNFVPSNF